MAERPEPVTAGELREALATFPDDAPVYTYEAGTGMGSIAVEVDGTWFEVWDGVSSDGNWHGDDGEAMYEFFEEHRPRGMNRG